MVNTKKFSKTKQKPGEETSKINFGKFHEYVNVNGQIKTAHELTKQETLLLIEDFKKVKSLEKEEEAELKALKYFEKKLQELIENLVYLDGYIQQIKDGNPMLKINPSVKELGTNLLNNMEEIENLSASILKEEGKVLGLAKHVRQVLVKAKEYQNIIFG